MQTLIQDGKYQVIKLLRQNAGFTSCLCINIETSNHYQPLIVSTYESADSIRRYLPAFYAMRDSPCSDFIDMSTAAHSISAVFTYHEGIQLPEYFARVDKDDFELRMHYADKLFLEALILDALDDCIAYAVLSPECVVVDKLAEKVHFNYIVPPLDGIPPDYKSQRTAEILKTIFEKNRFVPDGVPDFINALGGTMKTDDIVEIYAKWKHAESGFLDEYEILKKETLPAYFSRRIKTTVKRNFFKR